MQPIQATTTCAFSGPRETSGSDLVIVSNGDNRNFQFASSTCVTSYAYASSTGTTSTSSIPLYINGFSYGDLVQGFVLFCIACFIAFDFFLTHTVGVKTRNLKRQFIGNNSEEGKELHDY